MTQAEQYRAKGRACEERAEATADPFLKKQLLEIALQWLQMAAREDKRER